MNAMVPGASKGSLEAKLTTVSTDGACAKALPAGSAAIANKMNILSVLRFMCVSLSNVCEADLPPGYGPVGMRERLDMDLLRAEFFVLRFVKQVSEAAEHGG